MSTILVIEDEPHIRENVTALLEATEYEVVAAPDGMEGLARAKTHHPDLVLCDVMMPRMDGLEVLERFRAHKSLSTVPFIFLTAKSEMQDIRRGMALGADDYLTKPFEAHDLFKAIETRLKRFGSIERKQGRRVAELQQSISKVIPHELRTPLTVIEGYSDLLMDEWVHLDEEQATDMLGEVVEATRRLKRLVERNALYAKLTSGAYDTNAPRQRTTQVDPIVRDCARQCAATHDRLADLTLRIEPEALPVDPDLLRALVGELVNNAFKFSDAGTPVRVCGSMSAHEYVFSVSDQGRGISASQIQDISAYRQFDRDRYEQQGLGLGLALCQRICDVTGGRIEYESAPDAGTTVRVTMPGDPGKPVADVRTTAKHSG